MNPYAHLVSEYARYAREGRSYPLGNFPALPRPEIAPDAPKVLIFSPHPDDEVIIGALPLRLMREGRMNVINVAVTQGSRKDRQAGRYAELKNCCDYIGFGLIQTAPNGLEKVNAKTRAQEPEFWKQSVEAIANILRETRPRIIFFPHREDWNSSHIGTHHLVMDALAEIGSGLECFLVETEFWGQNDTPNLMVESSIQEVTDLITALTFHIGEVQRNPYHLILPAWMQDNLRRGAELVLGQGGAAPDMVFATLYQLRKWTNGTVEQVYSGGRQITSKDNPLALFA